MSNERNEKKTTTANPTSLSQIADALTQKASSTFAAGLACVSGGTNSFVNTAIANATLDSLLFDYLAHTPTYADTPLYGTGMFGDTYQTMGMLRAPKTNSNNTTPKDNAENSPSTPRPGLKPHIDEVD